jgi:hypothetical protein
LGGGTARPPIEQGRFIVDGRRKKVLFEASVTVAVAVAVAVAVVLSALLLTFLLPAPKKNGMPSGMGRPETEQYLLTLLHPPLTFN